MYGFIVLFCCLSQASDVYSWLAVAWVDSSMSPLEQVCNLAVSTRSAPALVCAAVTVPDTCSRWREGVFVCIPAASSVASQTSPCLWAAALHQPHVDVIADPFVWGAHSRLSLFEQLTCSFIDFMPDLVFGRLLAEIGTQRGTPWLLVWWIPWELGVGTVCGTP